MEGLARAAFWGRLFSEDQRAEIRGPLAPPRHSDWPPHPRSIVHEPAPSRPHLGPRPPTSTAIRPRRAGISACRSAMSDHDHFGFDVIHLGNLIRRAWLSGSPTLSSRAPDMTEKRFSDVRHEEAVLFKEKEYVVRRGVVGSAEQHVSPRGKSEACGARAKSDSRHRDARNSSLLNPFPLKSIPLSSYPAQYIFSWQLSPVCIT